ncbi:MAG: hypothetical protein M1825_002775 [Sarcosagium campestre]|nr:MAG: hypothetical protein M1825_002775 [Sarcosagium campestre]
MFGGSSSSPSKEPDGESSRTTQSSHGAPGASTRPDGVRPTVEVTGGEKRGSSTEMSPGGKSSDDENTGGEKKRRSSSKASALLASAKNSLHLSNSSKAEDEDSHSHSIQKLGRDDPALAVPQGSQNNSAGESVPGPRSTFRVGVTEDRNRKCRRAMEDTHSYLYNFLSTPAPATMGSDGSLKSDQSAEGSSPTTLAGKHPSDAVVETDNGYFAIFDGHAGSFAADWCGKKLHVILEDAIRKNPNTPIPDLLDHTFTLVDQSLEQLPLKNSGCTAVCAVLRWEDRIPSRHSTTGSTAIAPAVAAAVASAAKSNAPESTPSSKSANSTDQTSSSEAAGGGETEQARLQDSAARQRVLYTANVGDARVVLCRGGKALRLSYDHKGSDELEGKRVTNAGGLIINNRVNGVLAVTRALGDSYMKDLVTGHPYTTETIVQPESDEFIILACDGVR